MSYYQAKKLVDQSICYFYATTDGRMPSHPSRYLKRLERQLPELKRGWPNENWKVFHVVYPVLVDRHGELMHGDFPIIRNVSEATCIALINEVKRRYGLQWTDPNRYEMLKKQASEHVV